MNDPSPIADTESNWDAARAQLSCYLQALQVAGPSNQSHIITRILERARGTAGANPARSPVALAMDALHLEMHEWFAKLLGTRGHVTATGLVSLFAIDTLQRWHDAFLADQPPVAFLNALREAVVSAGPDLSFSSMVPQPFENALPDKIPLPAPLAEMARELSPAMAKLLAFAVVAIATLPATGPGTL